MVDFNQIFFIYIFLDLYFCTLELHKKTLFILLYLLYK
jgi:hypothetical protein